MGERYTIRPCLGRANADRELLGDRWAVHPDGLLAERGAAAPLPGCLSAAGLRPLAQGRGAPVPCSSLERR